MKLLLTLLLACGVLCPTLRAQEAPRVLWGLHATPSSLINFYPRFRIGGQAVAGQYSYLLDASYANFPTFWNNTGFRKGYHYIALRPEVRRYITTRPKDSGMPSSDYWALECALSQLALNVVNDAYEASDGEQYSFDEATRLKRQANVHIKYGLQRTHKGKLYLDVFIGCGLRAQHITYQDISNRVLRFDNPADEWLFNIERTTEGWSLRPSVTMGLRLGFVL
ncbi:MAG: hypothetical protein RIC19_00695 [Phaeodactylibacter sp.]|uniref:hypothetical protein n=1 Tax=Phaeodactylibacter sp. TaxID=1940289 RepID=UPI0032EBCA3A